MKGKKHTAEARQKMSAAHKGLPSHRKGVILSAETKAKISLAQKGRKLSAETKQKMSIAHKKFWATRCS